MKVKILFFILISSMAALRMSGGINSTSKRTDFTHLQGSTHTRTGSDHGFVFLGNDPKSICILEKKDEN